MEFQPASLEGIAILTILEVHTHRIHGTNGIFTYMKTIKINQM